MATPAGSKRNAARKSKKTAKSFMNFAFSNTRTLASSNFQRGCLQANCKGYQLNVVSLGMRNPRIGCNPNRILQHLWKNFDKNKKVLAMFKIFLPSANLTLNKAYPAMIKADKICKRSS
jgi:hypothetical protein